MADKTPLKYENAQHKPFEPGDTIPDSLFDLRGLIRAGAGFEVTEDAQGRVKISNTCCRDPDSEHIITEVNAPASVEEGERVCWTVVLDGPVEGSPLVLQGVLSGDEQAQHNYPAPSVTIPVGSSSGQMCVQTIDDTVDEPDRELCLAIAANPRIVSAPAPRCVTILDNDCTPNWQDTGPIRCTGPNVEAQQADGCGNTRWHNTGTPVAWTNSGAAVCVDGVLMQPQVNQCGDTRNFNTGTPCGQEPEFNLNPFAPRSGCCSRQSTSEAYEIILRASGTGSGLFSCWPGYDGNWMSGDDPTSYEVMLEAAGTSFLPPADGGSSPVGVWVPITSAGANWIWTVATGEGQPRSAVFRYRLRVRKIGTTTDVAVSQDSDVELRLFEECL